VVEEEPAAAAGLVLVLGLARVVQEEAAAVLEGAVQGARLVEAVVGAHLVEVHLVEGRAAVVVVVGAPGRVEELEANPPQYLALVHQCPHPRMEVEAESHRLFHRDKPSLVALKVVGQGVKYSVLSELAVIIMLLKQH